MKRKAVTLAVYMKAAYGKAMQGYGTIHIKAVLLEKFSSIARAFAGGRLAHPEGHIEDKNEEYLRKNKN